MIEEVGGERWEARKKDGGGEMGGVLKEGIQGRMRG